MSTTTKHGAARGNTPQPDPKLTGCGTEPRSTLQLAIERPARAGRERMARFGGSSKADHSGARGTSRSIRDFRGTMGSRSFGTGSPSCIYLMHPPLDPDLCAAPLSPPPKCEDSRRLIRIPAPPSRTDRHLPPNVAFAAIGAPAEISERHPILPEAGEARHPQALVVRQSPLWPFPVPP